MFLCLFVPTLLGLLVFGGPHAARRLSMLRGGQAACEHVQVAKAEIRPLHCCTQADDQRSSTPATPKYYEATSAAAAELKLDLPPHAPNSVADGPNPGGRLQHPAVDHRVRPR